MQKYLLILLFLLLNACSVSTPGFNRAEVVRFTPYVKHYRIYIERTHFKPIINNKKYLYFYHPKRKEPAILVHRHNHYTLYSLTDPQKTPFRFDRSYKAQYRHIIRTLKTKGYQPLLSLHSIGFTVDIGYRRFKGAKTILVEARDYKRLTSISKKAIKTYTPSMLDDVKTALPKAFIHAHYAHYHTRAKSTKQKEALQHIAQKLQLNTLNALTPTETVSQTAKIVQVQQELVQKKKILQRVKKLAKQRKEKIDQKRLVEETREEVEREMSYSYYLHKASSAELTRYLLSPKSVKSLSSTQYSALMKRKIDLRRETKPKTISPKKPTFGYKKDFLILK